MGCMPLMWFITLTIDDNFTQFCATTENVLYSPSYAQTVEQLCECVNKRILKDEHCTLVLGDNGLSHSKNSRAWPLNAVEQSNLGVERNQIRNKHRPNLCAMVINMSAHFVCVLDSTGMAHQLSQIAFLNSMIAIVC